MKSGKFWLAVLAAGVVMNVIDFLVYTQWLGPSYIATNAALFKQDANPAWYVLGDFIYVFVFAWVFDKVSSSFGGTIQDGAKAGFYLGVLVNFPMYIFLHLMFNGYPYALSWISTIYGIVWYVVVGVIYAAIMKKGAPAAV
ncbi:MAG: DUF1761 family protein [Ignavibacteriae bacterium]|nr:DUF1761 family protein [Ignavibacteriota bacterium]